MSLVRDLKFPLPPLIVGLFAGYLFSVIFNLVNDDVSTSERVLNKENMIASVDRSMTVPDEPVEKGER